MPEYIDYLSSVLRKIDHHKQLGNRAVYFINEKIPDNYAKDIQKYLQGEGYDVEIRKCRNCTHTWDITIRF